MGDEMVTIALSTLGIVVNPQGFTTNLKLEGALH